MVPEPELSCVESIPGALPDISALQQQVRMLNAVLDAATDHIYIWSRSCHILYAGLSSARAYGVTPDQMMGCHCSDLSYTPELAERFVEEIENVFSSAQGLRGTCSYTVLTGLRRYEYTLTPILNGEGKVEGVVSRARDVTEQKIAEEQLREQSELLTTLFENIPVLLCIWHPGLSKFQLNPAFTETLGWTDEDVRGGDFVSKVYPDPRYQQEVIAYMASLQPGFRDFRCMTKDGHYVHVAWANVRLSNDVMVGIGVDISERKQAEIILQESEQAVQEKARLIEVLNVRLLRAMRETHHRVKNNLQVISALAEMQTEEDTPVPADAMRRVGRHARNLAALHDLLTQEATMRHGVEDVSAQAALRKLMPLLQTAGGRIVRHECEDFMLPIRECGALTLLVSELVSNAIKHGKGDILVRLSKARSEEGTATLEVADEGPGFPPGFDPNLAARTGLDLILMLAGHDLRGIIIFENRPEGGGNVRVTFPL